MGDRNPGFVSGLAGFSPGDSACPRPKGWPKVQPSQPCILGLETLHASACPGLVPQYWELGACQPSVGLSLPHPSIPCPQALWERAALLFKASPWEGVSSAPLACRLGWVLPACRSGRLGPVFILWSPSSWASSLLGSPASAHASLPATTPHLLSIHAFCFPHLRRLHLLLPVPWSSFGSQRLAPLRPPTRMKDLLHPIF